ncbi:trypsin-like serine peptidase [Corallococcus macrosporus]|nr:serine protease [Corallococcus macrosporus]
MRVNLRGLLLAGMLLAGGGAMAEESAVCEGRTSQPPLQRDAQGRVKVGEDVVSSFKSRQPAARAEGVRAKAELSWTDRISSPGATYIAPHFSQFALAPGDYVIVRAPDGSREYRYEGFGKGDGKAPLREGFWSGHISGDVAIVELWSVGGRAKSGYAIDRFARGFANLAALGDEDKDNKALCGTDDSRNARCYQGPDPRQYKHSRAVARLLINGSGACTGWLVGNQGHVMTNEHCIANATDAANTDFEFMAEGGSCSSTCNFGLACPGTVVATTSTLIAVDAPRDYALVRLPTNPTATYGYLQLRNATAVVDERIYIPQHPAAWGKYIARNSTHVSDASGFAEVFALNRPACSPGGPLDIGYYADTQGGSSGSPVIANSDHRVVALHHCANCPNRGVPITSIISHLGSLLPQCALRSAACPDPYDVWMRDTWSDTGLEPDAATAGQDMWASPYIWIRRNPDGVANAHVHQNPELGATNYVYVKLHGGPRPGASGRLKLYYANASTGLDWDSDWTQFGDLPINGFPADTHIAMVPWSGLPGEGHYCLVARWESAFDPMSFLEGTDIGTNVRQNNNIIWRNVNIVDLESGSTEIHFIVRNVHRNVRALSLAVRVPEAELGRPFPVKAGRVLVRLPEALFKGWLEAGGRAEGLEMVNQEGTFEVTSPEGGVFHGLPLAFREEHQVRVRFERSADATEEPYRLEFVQFDQDAPDRESLGGIGYDIYAFGEPKPKQ